MPKRQGDHTGTAEEELAVSTEWGAYPRQLTAAWVGLYIIPDRGYVVVASQRCAVAGGRTRRQPCEEAAELRGGLAGWSPKGALPGRQSVSVTLCDAASYP